MGKADDRWHLALHLFQAPKNRPRVVVVVRYCLLILCDQDPDVEVVDACGCCQGHGKCAERCNRVLN